MKKILLMLAMLLPCVGAIAQIQPSTKTDAPEYLYKIKSKNGLNMAAHANPTQENYGRFAFYAVDGKENTYKIYSYDADLWLSYTKKAGYSDGMNFVSFASTQEDANEWCVTKANNGYYQVAPYNTTSVAGRYWNFYGGIANVYYAYDDHRNTLGLYNKNADGDGGSAWTLEAVAADDYTAPTTLNYVLTDGNGNVYTGTYTGVAGRTRLFTHQNTLCPITNVTFEGTTYKANITFPFPVSNTETTNKLMINGYNSTTQDFKWYVKEGTYIKVNENSAPTLETINDYLWAIYPTFNEGKLTFTIKNIATEKFITSSTLTAAHGNNTLGLADTGVAFELVNNRGCAFKVTDETLYLSINSSTDGKGEQPVGLHGSLHDGTSVGFIPYVIKYELTDEANNTFAGEAEGWAALEIAPTFTGAEGYTLSNHAWGTDTLKATINFPLPVSSATAVNTTLIGQGTWNNADKKWTVVDGNVKVVNGTATLGASQWVIYPSLNGTEFTFKIMSASTGKYVTANPASNADATASSTPITLTENGTGFQYINTGIANTNGFAYKNNNETTLFITRNGEYDNNALLGVFGASTGHKGNGIRFPELTSYKFTVGSTGFATLYSPVAGTFAEEVKTYAIESASDNSATLTEKTGVAANQGAIVEATPGTYTFTAGEVSSDWNSNLLTGSSVNTLVNESAYVLALVDSEAVLALAELNKNANGEAGDSHFLNNAGKAYLPASAVSTTAQVLRFNLGGTTAIESVLNNGADANAPIYDLSGRRVMNAVKGGIYIQNGKKFIVK